MIKKGSRVKVAIVRSEDGEDHPMTGHIGKVKAKRKGCFGSIFYQVVFDDDSCDRAWLFTEEEVSVQGKGV